MNVFQRASALAAWVMLLSVPAMAWALRGPNMVEPQAQEVAAIVAAVDNQAIEVTPVASNDLPSLPVVTLTEWTYTGLSPCGPYPKGDMNRDGVVNGLDVDLFVRVIVYGSYSIQELCLADVNGDGYANGVDVDPFVALVLGVM